VKRHGLNPRPSRRGARQYSLYLALQLKPRMKGMATPVYKRAAVHHTE
jgi:hypothetical protein